MAGNNNTPIRGQKEACKTCGKVKGPLKKVKDSWLGCEGCSEWFHTECEKISDVQYKVINEMGGSLKWKCKKCNEEEKDVLRVNAKGDNNDMVKELQKMFAELLDNKITNMEDKLKAIISHEINTRLDKVEEKQKEEREEIHLRIEKLERERRISEPNMMQSETRKEFERSDVNREPKDLRKHIHNELRELRERQDRRKNIIIMGLDEEIPMNTVDEGKKWIQETLEISTDIDIADCYRLGKKGNKTRAVKVNMKTEEQQKIIYNKRKVLINTEGGKYRKVYINADKTKMQREEQKVWWESKGKWNSTNRVENRMRDGTGVEQVKTRTEENVQTDNNEETESEK